MNKQNLIKALSKNEFVSDPDGIADLLEQSHNVLAESYPDATITPEATVGLAQLIMYYEDVPEETTGD
ncbi:MAG: hypothetical protein N4A71_11015 [Carboxylicivirga sp.]|jgi:hypothetical protein|nr:hypothetical protein [Carboxylicivirga sp.]